MILVSQAILDLGDAGEEETIDVLDDTARGGENPSHQSRRPWLALVLGFDSVVPSPDHDLDLAGQSVPSKPSPMEKSRMRHVERIFRYGVNRSLHVEALADGDVAGLFEIWKSKGLARGVGVRSREDPDEPILLAAGIRGNTAPGLLRSGQETRHRATSSAAIELPAMVATFDSAAHGFPKGKRGVPVSAAIE
jgi:hypothetical protein